MTAGNLNHFQRHRFNRGAGSMAGDCEHQPPPPGVTKTQGSRVITVITTGEKIMPMGMPEWDGTPESAREINCAFNAVLDVLVNAGMWTGDPPYRGKNAAEQVRMLVQRATTGSQLATDILAALGDANARAEAAEAQLAAVPAYATYHFEAQLYHDLAEGPEPLNFAGWLAAGQPEGAHNG